MARSPETSGYLLVKLIKGTDGKEGPGQEQCLKWKGTQGTQLGITGAEDKGFHSKPWEAMSTLKGSCCLGRRAEGKGDLGSCRLFLHHMPLGGPNHETNRTGRSKAQSLSHVSWFQIFKDGNVLRNSAWCCSFSVAHPPFFGWETKESKERRHQINIDE